MRKLKIYKRAEKFLKHLPKKQQFQIIQCAVLLETDTQPQDSKKLKGYDYYFRVDSGEYRIVYRWDDELVHVILIGKRNDSDVYKKLKRMEK